MTTITVSHQRNRWCEGGGSDQYAVTLSFETPISADAERELMSRIQQAQIFVEESVLRRAVPPSETLKKFRERLPTYTEPAQFEAASAHIAKLFNEGKVDRREANIMDEEVHDGLMLLAALQITLPAGDGTDKVI